MPFSNFIPTYPTTHTPTYSHSNNKVCDRSIFKAKKTSILKNSDFFTQIQINSMPYLFFFFDLECVPVITWFDNWPIRCTNIWWSWLARVFSMLGRETWTMQWSKLKVTSWASVRTTTPTIHKSTHKIKLELKYSTKKLSSISSLKTRI